ncbi:hypothetical protein L3V82_05060 [Thiotrichales bacterium 19S3-7]|nr:hypothetical protein [Thiotrichales bacterium 19S3-7]MCF6801462.1 hypothetical protein [Thiotrichales bacterium 19S3-11]
MKIVRKNNIKLNDIAIKRNQKLNAQIVYDLGQAYLNEFGEEPVTYFGGRIKAHTNQPIATSLKDFALDNPEASHEACLEKLMSILDKKSDTPHLEKAGSLMFKIAQLLNSTLNTGVDTVCVVGRVVQSRSPSNIHYDFQYKLQSLQNEKSRDLEQ